MITLYTLYMVVQWGLRNTHTEKYMTDFAAQLHLSDKLKLSRGHK